MVDCFVVALQGHQVLVGNAVFLSNGSQGVLLRHLQKKGALLPWASETETFEYSSPS